MNRLRRRWWDLHHDEDAVSLVEVLLAAFILATAVMALGSVGVSSLIQLRMAQDREQATNAASAAIEHARSFDFREIAHASGIDLEQELPDDLQTEIGLDGPQCAAGEPAVTDGSAADPIPVHRQAGNRNSIDLYTVITYADGECDPETTSDMKRVVSLARFVDGSRVEWVRQETLVTSAGRGLPVPNFRVRPRESSLRFSPSHTDDGTTRCRDHQLRNLGAPDRYEWELLSFDGEQAKDRNGNGWHPHNKDWEVSAYLHVPEQSSGGTPPGDEHQMDVLSDNDRYASDEEVETAETATFTVCYTPTKSVTSADYDVALAVHSRFDDRKLAELSHNVTVEDPGEAYYLLSRTDDDAHARPRNDDGVVRPSLMVPDVEVGGSDESLSRIGDIDYTDVNRSDWTLDHHGGTPMLPGLRLLRGESEPDDERSADWRYQFSSKTTVLSSPTPLLTLWVAPTTALTDGQSVPEEGLPVTLDVRLDGLDQNEEDNPFWIGFTTTHSYTHFEEGWQRVEIELPIDANQEFKTNRRLRVQVRCNEASEEDCHLAFDNEHHQSRLEVDTE